MRIGIGGGNRLLRGGFSAGSGGVRGGVGVGPVHIGVGGGRRRGGNSLSGDEQIAIGLTMLGIVALVGVLVGLAYFFVYGAPRILLPVLGFLEPFLFFFLLLAVGDLVARYWFDRLSYILWIGSQIGVFFAWTAVSHWGVQNALVAGATAPEDDPGFTEGFWNAISDGAEIARWFSIAGALVIIGIWIFEQVFDRFDIADHLDAMADQLDAYADRVDGGDND